MSDPSQPIGVLLINLGTPDAPRTREVRRYLREFLSDPLVIDLPAVPRWLLVNAVILPTRPRRSAAAYAKVWGERGSPLLSNGIDLRDALATELGGEFRVALGMRYGNPSIASAIAELEARNVEEIVALPLFPQYSRAATASARTALLAAAADRPDPPNLSILGDFYDHPAFIEAQAEICRPALDAFAPDHVLFSYHGLPERQLTKSDRSGTRCRIDETCCVAPGAASSGCYRAQCFATTLALAASLELKPELYSTSFQSRLGRTPWIQPFTDEVLPELARQGVRRLAVLSPSFTSDCLETLEEIGMRAREQWSECGGEELLLLPCVNAEPAWVRGLAGWIRERAPRRGRALPR